MARGSLTSPNSPLPVSPVGLHTINEIQSCVLADPPLMTLYEEFLQADQRATNISSAQDVVIISGDSSLQPANSFASVSGGGISNTSMPSDHQTARPSDHQTARASTNEPARARDHNELASARDIV
ncbi:hypothetical protein ACFE04_020682 [Oxalis oulophora]